MRSNFNDFNENTKIWKPPSNSLVWKFSKKLFKRQLLFLSLKLRYHFLQELVTKLNCTFDPSKLSVINVIKAHPKWSKIDHKKIRQRSAFLSVHREYKTTCDFTLEYTYQHYIYVEETKILKIFRRLLVSSCIH